MHQDAPFEGMWIDGKRTPGRAGQRMPVINPATGQVIAQVAMAGREDVDDAVQAARRAWEAGSWRKASSSQRATVLLKLAALLREHTDELATLETRNAGKTISDTRGEVPYAADTFQYYAGLIPTYGGFTVPVGAPGTGLVFREPIGVVALIVPWNYPLVIAAWKLAPALAMGNSVVLKPAETTPLTALRLAELAQEAGLPDGVLNVIPGDGPVAGAALVRHPQVRKIGFTGSTEVGAEIMRAAADGIKRVGLELGGKSASIVFADADLEKASSMVMSIFANAGQDCCARSRYLVERSVYGEFLERFVENSRKIRVGDPMDPKSQLGSLISSAHREKVDGLVKQGVAEGGKICLGGGPLRGETFDRGFFYQPTIFSDVKPEAVIAQQEIFGPVVAFMPFDTEEEAIRLANSTVYGLSGSLWTRDVSRALRVARGVESGVLAVNSKWSVHLEMPFGGFKQSGVGRELGPQALDQYSELKSVFIPH